MGASSSGLLDEAKTSHIKGLVDTSLQSFSMFYRQQYPAAYFRHLLQEVEPKKQERGLLLTQRPRSDPDEVLYESRARFSTWDDQSKKGKEKYVVLKRNYNLEIHESQETFLRGSAAKFVLQPVGGAALTSEDEAKSILEQSCSGILNGVKEDTSAAASPSEGFAVHLHIPHNGLYCFLFQHDYEQHHFLSALKSCIRHHNLDPWSEASYERQAFVHALRLYRRDKGCHEYWEMLLGSEEQALAAQLMQEVLLWLQSQLQNKVKGKKMERIRLWLATVHAAYTVVLEHLKPGLEALREECQRSASANQGLIRSNLDQITASHSFLLEKIQGCVSKEAERALSEFISPYLPSVLDALTENIGPAHQEMRQTLQAQIDSALAEKGGGNEVTKKVSSLTKTGLEKCYQQADKLKNDLSNLRERFGLSSTARLVHSAHLDMEKLLDSAVYTFELFLRTSARLQPDQYSVKTNQAKKRVLKQLDYDSRLVQKRLYEEALLHIALPILSQRVDSTRKQELQPFEQYIFSDFSSFILVPNVYQDVLQNILNKEIQKVLQEATSKTSSNLLLDTSDLALSQYSLLGETPSPSTPSSPTLPLRDAPSTVSVQDSDTAKDQTPNSEANNPAINVNQLKDIVPPIIVVTQENNDNSAVNPCVIPFNPVVDLLQYESSDSDSIQIWEEISDSDPLEVLESLTTFDDDALEGVPQNTSPETTDAEVQGLERLPEDSSDGHSIGTSESATSQIKYPMKISLETLSEAIVHNVQENVTHQSSDKAVYLKGSVVEHWQSESQKEGIKTDYLIPEDGTAVSNTVQKLSEEEITDEQSVEKIDTNAENVEIVSNNNTSCDKEGFKSSAPIERQDQTAEKPLDSIAAIRDLVTEVTEVEITINPHPPGTD